MLAMSDKSKAKQSTVRHTRAIQRDRTKRPTVAPSAEVVEQQLAEVVQPAIYAQIAAYQAMGLRHRILTLPVMVAFVLSLIWRQIGSAREAVRTLGEEGFLWAPPLEVSQQAVSERLRTFPAELFKRVLLDLLPLMHERAQSRERPLPPAVAYAKQHFSAIYALDGSTLDVLLRKVGLLRDLDKASLAGRIAALLDITSHLPRQVWFEDDSQAHDQRFWSRVIETLDQGVLLIFDLGFLSYPLFDQLTQRGIGLVTRAKHNSAYRVQRVLQKTASLHDQVVFLGSDAQSCCAYPMRLVEVLHQGKWYRYLTNVLDPEVLPAQYVLALYWQRWRIEDALNTVKRLLGLAYLWVGSNNGVQLQVWATWLLYAVLVDLTDAVAEELGQPFRAISLEMVYRGLYHFTQAYHRGNATDPVAYLATKAKVLDIVKQRRPSSASNLAYLTLVRSA
jgi:hypothetical protein